MTDPARFAVTAFAAVLETRGIRVTGGVATTRAPLPAGTRVLAFHDGASMAEMVRVVNKESENLHAEMLLRLVGLRAKGEGSVENGREAAFELLKRLGVDTGGWSLSDGSGLARTRPRDAAGDGRAARGDGRLTRRRPRSVRRCRSRASTARSRSGCGARRHRAACSRRRAR